ncbi:MAG: restriction endonuclease, partial [Candidatus Omnitrophota bacterium]
LSKSRGRILKRVFFEKYIFNSSKAVESRIVKFRSILWVVSFLVFFLFWVGAWKEEWGSGLFLLFLIEFMMLIISTIFGGRDYFPSDVSCYWYAIPALIFIGYGVYNEPRTFPLLIISVISALIASKIVTQGEVEREISRKAEAERHIQYLEKIQEEELQRERLLTEERFRIMAREHAEKERMAREKEKRKQIKEENKKQQEIRNEFEKVKSEEFKKVVNTLSQTSESVLSLGPYEFENLCAEMFDKLGYSVQQTSFSSDGGFDGLLIKGGVKYIYECKKFDVNRKIGRPMMQKFRAAMHDTNTEKGYFITTGQFSQTAVEYALKNKIILIDLTELMVLMQKAFGKGKETIKSIRTVCLKCGRTIEFSIQEGVSKHHERCECGAMVENDLADKVGRAVSGD